jgi:hypothetical protein
VRHFKDQFAQWIVSSGLRELIEHYGLLLNKMHGISLRVMRNAGKLQDIDPEKAHERFVYSPGFPAKLKGLESVFGLTVPHADSLIGLYLARNAPTHNFGYLTEKHCQKGTTGLRLTWQAFETIAVGADTGIEMSVLSLIGKKTAEEMDVSVRPVTRERDYKIRDRIRFAPQDLSEICAFFSMSVIPDTIKVFADFLLVNGAKEAERLPAAEKARDR